MLSAMFRRIGVYGFCAGAFVGAVLSLSIIARGGEGSGDSSGSYLIGYASMLLGLSVIFVAVKRQRDISQGGVIKFLPAFGMGLAISFIAGVVYALAWELTLALTGLDFAGAYAEAAIETAKAKGMAGTELEAYTAKMQDFAKMYSNPAFRIPMTFTEIFPVGVLVSLVCALLLRNSRFFPARG
ncbi:MAG: DUF4199 domain-containing protein [Hyphomonas sp.]